MPADDLLVPARPRLGYRLTQSSELARLSVLADKTNDPKDRRMARRVAGMGFPALPSFDPEADLLGKTPRKVIFRKTDRYEEWEVENDFCPISDQLGLSACEGNAWFDAMEILLGPHAYVALARLFGYWGARFSHGAENNDDGTFAGAIGYSIRIDGLPREELWPYVEKNVNVRPDDLAFADAYSHRIEEIYAVRVLGPKGRDRVNVTTHTIQSGFVLPIGVQLGKEWYDVDASERAYFAPTQSIGGHEMIVVATRVWSDGRIWFKLKNSWGKGWGIRGFAWIDASYLADPVACDEVSVPTLAPPDYDVTI